jgi:translation initiation factor 2B subunit (eIF-2B alpha/beta/delta family)
MTLFEENEQDIVTLSASGSVTRLLEALRSRGPLRVSCSEGRPALEGRRLAERLAALGVEVTFLTDAALAAALDGANAVLVGADAVGPRHFVNKTGTRMLLSAAGVAGVPVYVAATRDKFVMPALWPRLTIRHEPPAEVWDAPPAGVLVRNPYFETVPLDLTTGVISDVGVLGSDMVREVCASLEDPLLLAALDEL